jgi:NitT/TauT family transport system ATP-binding protein
MHQKLSIQNLSRRFVDLLALDRINLEIPSGCFVSIVGPSGCGKTTLLRIVGGLDAQSDGKILLDGQVINGPGTDRGFVFQSANLLLWRNVYDNVCLGLEIAKSERKSHATIASLLKMVGLEGFEKYYPRQLSGGMQQRANLARALAVNPQLLLMDEPFSALDAQTREIMQTELMRIWEEGRKTVLFVTHQIDEAVFLSDQVVVLARRPGRIQEIVQIDLPRPRSLSIKRSPIFVDYVDRIWKLIEHDVRESALSEDRVVRPSD